MKIIQDSQKGLKVTDGWWCGRFHLPQKTQMVLSEIQGLSIFVNDQEAELDDWNDKNRRTWNSLSWLSTIHDTFFSETNPGFVHSSESWILGFWTWRWDRVTPLGWRCARSGRLQALMDFMRIQDFLKQLKLEIDKIHLRSLFFWSLFFFVLNQRWCEQWKNGKLGCFGLYRGGTFWLYLGSS